MLGLTMDEGGRRSRTDTDFRTALYDRYVSTFKSGVCLNAEPSFAWWDHKYLPLLDDLDRAAPILEIGCGGGGLLLYLERRGFSHAAGIDISGEQVELARQRGVRAEVGDVLESLAGQAGALEAILAVDVFEHFSRDELVRMAPLLYAALRPGGRLLVQTANGAGLFRASGFVDLTFYETGPIPIRLRGKVDVALWSAIKALASAVRHIETGKRQTIWTENFICVARKTNSALTR
jgi:SAM-dependent methyltransferase